MTLAQLTNVHLAFGARDILTGVSLGITDKSRLALTGANGSGKTTLLRLLAGHTRPDQGQLSLPDGVRVSYLPQDATVAAEGSLYDVAEEAFAPIRRLIGEQDEIGEKLKDSLADEPSQQALIERFHELEQRIDASGYYRREAAIDYILTGLGFGREDFQRPVSDFSGGWRMRIALSRILLEAPDLLLLDEPTNYLDLEARDWLESFLQEYKGGVVVVSHDRDFLDRVTTQVAELFIAQLRLYSGNFTAYEKTRHAELAELEKKYKEQQAEIARLEEFIRRFRYNASRASQVQSRVRQLEKIEPIELPETMKPIHFSFPEAPASGKQVVQIRNLEKTYDAVPLFDGIELDVVRGEKVVVVGKNGAGKTTLLRMLAGADDKHSGEIRYGSGVALRSFSPDAVFFEEESRSVLEAVEEQAPTEMYPQLRDLLGAFLFRGDDVYKPVSVLSGGERSRLALATMLLSPANLLVLDEPTNHLDMASKDVLLSALESFSGSVVFVSHDRHFIRQLATRVIELSRGDESSPSRLRNFPGDYDYYRRRKSNEESGAAAGNGRQAGAGRPAKASRSPTEENGSAQARHLDLKKRRNRLKQIERQEEELLDSMEAMERRESEIKAEMSRPEIYANGEEIRKLQQELQESEQKRHELTEQWERLESERASLEEPT